MSSGSFRTAGSAFNAPSFHNRTTLSNPDGTEKWSFGVPASYCSPIVDAEGSVYIGGDNGFFYAFNADGSLKWTYQAADSIDTSPAISEDGRIYFGDDGAELYCIGP